MSLPDVSPRGGGVGVPPSPNTESEHDVSELDYSRVTQVIGDWLAEDPGWLRDLEDNRLTWALSGWDEAGWGDVEVIHKVTGQLVASARVHRSALQV